MKPNQGGSYSRSKDGSLSQREAPTGERPCKCRDHKIDKVDTSDEILPEALPEAPAMPPAGDSPTTFEE